MDDTWAKLTAGFKAEFNSIPVVELTQNIAKFGRGPVNENAEGWMFSRDYLPLKLTQIAVIHFSITREGNENGKQNKNPPILHCHSKKGLMINKDILKMGDKRILLDGDYIKLTNRCVLFQFHDLRERGNYFPKEIYKNYFIGEQLGKGNYGKINKIHKKTLETLAMKTIILDTNKSTYENKMIRTNREIEIMKKVNHPNLMALVECYQNRFENSEYRFLLMDLMDMDLTDFIRKYPEKFIPEVEAKFYFYQICKGVEHLHQKNIAHRDIKPDNIFLKRHLSTSMLQVRVGDFGFSKHDDNDEFLTQLGTKYFTAPEVFEISSHNIQKKPYTTQADVWSLGCVLYAMVCGHFPFSKHNNTVRDELRKRIKTADYHKDILKHTSLKARALIDDLLKPIPNERPTVSRIVRSYWFDCPTVKDLLKQFVEQTGLPPDYDTLNASNAIFFKQVSRLPKPVFQQCLPPNTV